MSEPTQFPPPNITRWVNHQTVSTTALLKELEDWAGWLRTTWPTAADAPPPPRMAHPSRQTEVPEHLIRQIDS